MDALVLDPKVEHSLYTRGIGARQAEPISAPAPRHTSRVWRGHRGCPGRGPAPDPHTYRNSPPYRGQQSPVGTVPRAAALPGRAAVPVPGPQGAPVTSGRQAWASPLLPWTRCPSTLRGLFLVSPCTAPLLGKFPDTRLGTGLPAPALEWGPVEDRQRTQGENHSSRFSGCQTSPPHVFTALVTLQTWGVFSIDLPHRIKSPIRRGSRDPAGWGHDPRGAEWGRARPEADPHPGHHSARPGGSCDPTAGQTLSPSPRPALTGRHKKPSWAR